MSAVTASVALPIAISPQDRLVINGANWICALLNQHGYNLVKEDDSDTTRQMTFQELRTALTHQKARVHWGYHSEAQKKLRDLMGGDRRDGFKESHVMVARFREKLILAYEAYLRKHLKLRSRDVSNMLPQWAEAANRSLAKFKAPKLAAKSSPLPYQEAPSVRAFLRDYQLFLECGRDPRSLLPRYRGPGRAKTTAHSVSA